MRVFKAAAVVLGYLSHLLLDELYSVEWKGIRIRLNKFAGSAFKLFGEEFLPNVILEVNYLTQSSVSQRE